MIEQQKKSKWLCVLCDTAVRYQATDSAAAVVTFHRCVSIENVHSSSSQKCHCALRSMTLFLNHIGNEPLFVERMFVPSANVDRHTISH